MTVDLGGARQQGNIKKQQLFMSAFRRSFYQKKLNLLTKHT